MLETGLFAAGWLLLVVHWLEKILPPREVVNSLICFHLDWPEKRI